MNVYPNPEPQLHSEPEKGASDSNLQRNSLGGSDFVTEKKTLANSSPKLRPTFNPESESYLRELIRSLQCKICNQLLRQPLALPCGDTLCRTCIPRLHERRYISYPSQSDRKQGFTCPFEGCHGQEHSIADCSLDITLTNVLTSVEIVLSDSAFSQDSVDTSSFPSSGPGKVQPIPPDKAHIYKVFWAYRIAKDGTLPFTSDFPTPPGIEHSEGATEQEKQHFANLLARLRSDFDCQVCYCPYNSPTTTSCGHTFCKACLERVRDHSNLCPFCRKTLSPYRNISTGCGNKRLTSLVSLLYPQITADKDTQASEGEIVSEQTIPIFACAMTFPQIPMFLHIFEPRYRLMLRRAIEDGTRCFGMVAHRPGSVPPADGDFVAPFTRYGTMLYVTNLQMFPDGRSLVETMGIYRFKIISYSWQDGYPLANIERVEDIPYADEEAMEASERINGSDTDSPTQMFSHLSTQELYQRGFEFVASMRNESVGWFADRILNTYGQPPQDPAIFPFWMATLLPVNEREKYLVLVSTSVRERLKLVMVWIKAMDQKSCIPAGGHGISCIVS
ncbi:hypothetical protein TWF694_008693 [Orbilia ellipsospora]|uniref:ATP-dependent protease n=1 Tax=Orbilia ellipsospora TaxID=2528407 RepID=A0AAV9XD74_9PEZI